MAKLRFLDDPATGFELGTEFTIGRAPENSLAIADDLQVSREHARIVHAGARYTLFDLGSSNGTHVEREGRRWQVAPEVALRDGDIILIGQSRLVFEAGLSTQVGMNDAPETMVGRVVPPLRAD